MAPWTSLAAVPGAPVPSAPAAASSSISANNTLFLIAFGMFLTASVLPALLTALVKLAVIVAAVALAAAATNPSDHSFACWVSNQETIRTQESMTNNSSSSSVSQWLSTVVKSAIAIVRNEPLTWRTYNVVVCTVVFVPVANRYALGCFGAWRWADATGSVCNSLCRHPWINKLARGGVESGMERYVDTAARSTSSSTSRRRHVETAAASTAVPASMPSAIADVLQAAGFSTGTTSTSNTVSDVSDRELRTRAVQFKIQREWKDAARSFLDAAAAARTTLATTTYRLEAAWCLLEDSDTFPTNKKTQLLQMVHDVCEELASSGYYDEAARAFAELALRLKRKFPQDLGRQAFATDIALLFVQAKNVAEAGGHTRSAVENALRAANVYVAVGLWLLAEECFASAGEMELASTGASPQASDALGCAVLCRIGQLDVVGADAMTTKHAQLLAVSSFGYGRSNIGASDLDVLLASVCKAYSKGSLQIFDTACKRYDATRRLAPWQWACLNNLRAKMTSADLR